MTEIKNSPSDKRQEWTRPELVRLGTIRDIAQGPTPLAQANSDKKS